MIKSDNFFDLLQRFIGKIEVRKIGFNFHHSVCHIKRHGIKHLHTGIRRTAHRKFNALSIRKPALFAAFYTADIAFYRAISCEHKRKPAVNDNARFRSIYGICLIKRKLKRKNRRIYLICGNAVKNIKAEIAERLKSKLRNEAI